MKKMKSKVNPFVPAAAAVVVGTLGSKLASEAIADKYFNENTKYNKKIILETFNRNVK